MSMHNIRIFFNSMRLTTVCFDRITIAYFHRATSAICQIRAFACVHLITFNLEMAAGHGVCCSRSSGTRIESHLAARAELEEIKMQSQLKDANLFRATIMYGPALAMSFPRILAPATKLCLLWTTSVCQKKTEGHGDTKKAAILLNAIPRIIRLYRYFMPDALQSLLDVPASVIWIMRHCLTAECDFKAHFNDIDDIQTMLQRNIPKNTSIRTSKAAFNVCQPCYAI